MLAFSALGIGLVIIKFSISNAGMIRENVVSCIPEELSDMFDQEQSIICSNVQSQKSALLAGILLGGCIAVSGFIVALVSAMQSLMRKAAKSRSHIS